MLRALALAIVLGGSTACSSAATDVPERHVVIPEARWVELTPAPTHAQDLAEPTRRPASGVASWYRDAHRSGLYAAMHRFTWGDPITDVRVCAGARCVTVPVVDYCACYVGTPDERAIDLSPAAFRRLAPLSRGLVPVTIEEIP